MKIPVCILLLLSLLVGAFAGIDNKNIYSNAALGLTIEKPKDWIFAAAEQQSEALDVAKFKDTELQDYLKKHSTVPIVAIAKEPVDPLDLGASIQIKVVPAKSSGPPETLLASAITLMTNAVENLEVVEKVKETPLAKRSAIYTKIYYKLVTEDGRRFAVCSELWVVSHGESVFLIGAVTRRDEKTGTRAEIHRILSSLKLE